MNSLKQRLWWIADCRSLLGDGLFMLMVLLIVALLGWKDIEESWPGSVYTFFGLCSAWGFLRLSAGLSEYARADVFKLLPNFASDLHRGLMRCVLFMVSIGALYSLVSGSWLPLLSMSYVAVVLAAMHFPVWRIKQQRLEGNQVWLLGAELRVSWPTLLSLSLPLLVQWLGGPLWGLVGMALSIPAWLFLMGKRLPIQAERLSKTQRRNLILEPSMAMVGAVGLLVLSLRLMEGSDRFHIELLATALPWMGLSSMVCQSPDLRALQGRLWLLGMSRVQICRAAMLRLFFALASEFALYMSVVLIVFAFGRICLVITVKTVCVLFCYAVINWGRLVLDAVLAPTLNKPDPFARCWPLVMWIAMSVPVLYLSLSKQSLAPFVCAVLLALGAVYATVRRTIRHFERAELW